MIFVPSVQEKKKKRSASQSPMFPTLSKGKVRRMNRQVLCVDAGEAGAPGIGN